MAIGTFVSTAISIGSQLYNSEATRTDKRKARKQLRKLAKNTGVAYSDLKNELDSIYSKTIEDSPYKNAYSKVLEELESNGNLADVNRALPQSSPQSSPQEYKSDLKNRIKANVGGVSSDAMDKVLSLDDNLYASAIKDWSNEQNQDYRKYADELQNIQNWLKNRNTMSQNYQKSLYSQDKDYTDLVNKRISTLMNMDMGNMQTQNNVANQIQGI